MTILGPGEGSGPFLFLNMPLVGTVGCLRADSF